MRAAGKLLNTELSGPVDLGGSSRSTVLRCETAGGGTVIVKFPAFAETMRLLLREVAGGWDVARLPGYPAFETRGTSGPFRTPDDVTTVD